MKDSTDGQGNNFADSGNSHSYEIVPQQAKSGSRDEAWRDATLVTILEMMTALAASAKERKVQYLTTKQVANRWQIGVRTVWRFISQGRLPVHKIGGMTRILEQDVVRFETEEAGKAGGNGTAS